MKLWHLLAALWIPAGLSRSRSPGGTKMGSFSTA